MLFMAACLACTAQESTPQPRPGDSEAVERVIMSRRSIRKYTPQKIGRETLQEILRCGINAPNGQNRQAYEIRVIDDAALLTEISDAARAANPQVKPKNGARTIFCDAPCVVFIACDTSYGISQIDCGLLGENIILAAWAKGIGSCCLGSSARWILDSPSAKPYLDRMAFSKGYQLLYCIALGYPDEAPAAKPRRDDMIKFME